MKKLFIGALISTSIFAQTPSQPAANPKQIKQQELLNGVLKADKEAVEAAGLLVQKTKPALEFKALQLKAQELEKAIQATDEFKAYQKAQQILQLKLELEMLK